ncbi:response regulator [Paenibacillus thermoaerophilus]|uniref:Response regulator n=1 Tax=Paenibacillus thermoaerophilus TaxID=1215385 RepID=A0ABW2V6K9_9BACL|nr:response regulator [Paenibacillus thermoaerophilus]
MYYSAVIVDDEHLIRSSLSKKIGDCRNVIAVGTAANGVKCLEWLEHHYADICITDVRMPHMDGLELIRRINERYPWMTSIVVSSHDDFAYVRASLQLNAVDYVMKPVEQSVLNESIEAAVRKLRQTRKDRAVALLVKKLPHHAGMLDRWITIVQTVQMEKMHMLVVDTLEMLESWVGDNYYLLYELALVWLELVLEEIKKEKVVLELAANREPDMERKPIPRDQARLFCRLLSVWRLEEGAQQIFNVMKSVKNNATHRTVELVKQYIREHFAEKINLQDVADAVSMSRTYLANLFKQETGTTIWNYLVSVRMQHAREMLLNSSMKSYEIALRVGYENSIHFSKLFKEHYGLNPMEYKKRMLG